MSPEDERERFWKALQVNSDRITELEAVVTTRNEMMRETITQAVQSAMPTALLNDAEHEFVQMLFDEWKDRKEYWRSVKRKIVESAAIWAIPIVIGALFIMAREYAIAHGMWKP